MFAKIVVLLLLLIVAASLLVPRSDPHARRDHARLRLLVKRLALSLLGLAVGAALVHFLAA
ncbi:MAG: hypothetical protein ACK4Q4_03445 [Rhodocyclaceae bacterium]